MSAGPPRVDGRTARSERTRNAIVDAHVQLIQEGDLRPTADRIARVAGVSLRALWSHFADMEALLAASGQRILDRRDAAFDPISPDLPLTERIRAFCHQRARLVELIAPAARAAALKEPFSPSLQHYRSLHMERLRDELKTLFAAEIHDDAELLSVLITVSAWATWETMRTPLKLTVDEARSALERTVTVLLRSPYPA
jgi:TetR/AcrR family transcriptional regulator of autoinduction and epiphytic fitness